MTSEKKENDRSIDHRLNTITIRLTDKELDLIQNRVKGLDITRSEYIRRQLLGKVQNIKTQNEEFNQGEYKKWLILHREWIAQGNNLNQIAMGINRANLDGRSIILDSDVLKSIETANNKIAKDINSLIQK